MKKYMKKVRAKIGLFLHVVLVLVFFNEDLEGQIQNQRK